MSNAELFFYLTTIGWKSGNPHEIEIWFCEHAGCYYLISEHAERAHWVQNIQQNPQVIFNIGKDGEPQPATASIPDQTSDDVVSVKTLCHQKYDWNSGLVVGICPTTVQ